MVDDCTVCPNCHQKSVSELPNCFQCSDCGNWGYSANRLPYRDYEPEYWRQDGQVFRKPRAA